MVEELSPKIIGHFTVGNFQILSGVTFEILFKYCLVFQQAPVIIEAIGNSVLQL